MHSDSLLQRAHRGRPTILPRVVLGASAGLLALAIAGPVQAAPPVHAQVHDGVLRVTGTPFADAIRLSLAVGDPSTVDVFVNNDPAADFSFADASLRAIVLDGAGGDDRLSVDTSNGAFPDAQPIILVGGAGDDELFGGLGHQTLLGGRGNDLIDGNQGADDQFGGSGNDVIVWDPGDGSDLVDGGSGFDTMQFNGSGGGEIFHAFQNGDRVTFTRNLGGIVMDVNDTEQIDLHALGGSDTLTVDDIDRSALREIDADLGSDTVNDSVVVNGSQANDAFSIDAASGAVQVNRAGAASTRISGITPEQFGSLVDTLEVDGLGGADTFAVGAGVNNLIELTTSD
jgi:RTX calcium-binding nonapeptide repeat (4 copies)